MFRGPLQPSKTPFVSTGFMDVNPSYEAHLKKKAELEKQLEDKQAAVYVHSRAQSNTLKGRTKRYKSHAINTKKSLIIRTIQTIRPLISK